MTKAFIAALLLAIVVALGAGMVFLVKDNDTERRTVNALTWRIGLSLLLLAVLIGGYFLGLIQPHGVRP